MDLNKDGHLDIMAGRYWLENDGKGYFVSHNLIDPALDVKVARFRMADIDEDGDQDMVVVEEDLSYQVKEAFFARFAWFENPNDVTKMPWQMHIIDKLRSPHSLDIADFDKDGKLEIVCAEHDPFKDYRSRSRMFVYKKADAKGDSWYRNLIDGRFEHHCGTLTIDLGASRIGIMSHGWKDSRYLHLWEPY